MSKDYTDFTNLKITELSGLCKKNTYIDPSLYLKYDVKRGLRDLNGHGVLAGLTDISQVCAYETIDGKQVPTDGKLFYRGYSIQDLVNGCTKDSRFGFEEIIYLLLFNKLPNVKELDEFKELLREYRNLPNSFVRDIIMKAPSDDMMNAMSRCVLTLYSYDQAPNDLSIDNVLRQCLQLIAQFPMIAVYSYNTFLHYYKQQALFITPPDPELSTAENILHLLRPNGGYTKLEALTLDMALMLHAEHGGGNNSTFTTRVVTSSGTDTYSAVAAALGSLKGPRHGGANIKVAHMFHNMKNAIKDWKDEEMITSYLNALLNKDAFDKAGLIYGIGHAIYSKSDPRACIFKKYVKSLSEEKGRMDEFELYSTVERLAPLVISSQKNMYKGVSANVDFYSGFVYEMLGFPEELFTPFFAISRIAGWSAHRIEELLTANKIIRPAYKSVNDFREYIDLECRN